jgi:hypothetical protein
VKAGMTDPNDAARSLLGNERTNKSAKAGRRATRVDHRTKALSRHPATSATSKPQCMVVFTVKMTE